MPAYFKAPICGPKPDMNAEINAPIGRAFKKKTSDLFGINNYDTAMHT